jgi:tRNA dimethylallyltransferase
MKFPNIIIICGQTATGKSSLAIELAQHLRSIGQPAEIISADSRQVYNGLDVSSNKVTTTEMRGVTHHMLSVAPCGTRYTVADYQTQTRTLITELIGKGITPILCGGTGLYIDAVMFEDFVFGEGAKGSIDYKNAKLWKPQTSPFPYEGDELVRWVGLTAPREYLVDKIQTLAIQKFDNIQKEIIELLESGIDRNWFTGLGLEPKLMISVLDGIMKKDKYIDELTTKSWQYARRQMTWFKRNPRIIWFDASTMNQQCIINSICNNNNE